MTSRWPGCGSGGGRRGGPVVGRLVLWAVVRGVAPDAGATGTARASLRTAGPCKLTKPECMSPMRSHCSHRLLWSGGQERDGSRNDLQRKCAWDGRVGPGGLQTAGDQHHAATPPGSFWGSGTAALTGIMT